MAGGQEDFESLARRYWGAWGDAMRAAAGGLAGGATPGVGAGAAFGAMPGAMPGFGGMGMPGFGGMPGMGAMPGLGAMPGAGAMPGFGGMPGLGGFPGFGAMPGFGAAPAFGAPAGFTGMPGFGGPSPFAMPGADANPATQAWRDAVDWWSRAARGGSGGADEVVDRLSTQVRDWFGQMQEVATKFAGQQASAADVVAAWKESLAGIGADPFGAMFRGISGPGQHGFDDWFAQVEPMLAGLRGEAQSWLRTPAFGFAREHQERWQKLADLQVEYGKGVAGYNALVARASQQAFELFEAKLGERAAAEQPVESARALFDLWIDAAEDAYQKVALSPEFRGAYAGMVNAQMRLRGAVQAEVEQACAQLGMPTRSELDGAHRKIVELERALRRQARAAGEAAKPPAPKAAPVKAPAAKKAAAGTPVPKKTVSTQAAPKTTATTQAASKVTTSKATASRKPVAKKATAEKPAPSKPAAMTPASTRSAAKKRAARSTAPAPARRQAPARRGTSLFSSAIPVAPAPLAPGGND